MLLLTLLFRYDTMRKINDAKGKPEEQAFLRPWLDVVEFELYKMEKTNLIIRLFLLSAIIDIIILLC